MLAFAQSSTRPWRRSSAIIPKVDFRCDPEADCAYIKLVPIAPGGVDHSVCVADEFPELKGDVNLDVDRDGRLLGIEIVAARKFLQAELLDAYSGDCPRRRGEGAVDTPPLLAQSSGQREASPRTWFRPDQASRAYERRRSLASAT
jgi:uncharacterized protein YuzE